MADEENATFDERWDAVPEEPTAEEDPQLAKKKELLKLMATSPSVAATATPVRTVSYRPDPPVVLQSAAQPRPAELLPTEPDEDVPVTNVPVKIQSGVKPPRSGLFKDQAIDSAIERAAKAYGIDANMLRAIASIESNGDPYANANKPGKQYKGLFQIGTRGPKSEWATHGRGDVFNPDDNAMAAAKLMRENADLFRKAMKREPTPKELYLMHQQGLGFYTRGKMTNIAGNLPKEAKRDPYNWTHAGFERLWGNKLQARMERAAAGQGPPYLANEKIAEFLSKDPIAMQEANLSGGLSDTPAAARQTAMLMTSTPVEQIAGLARMMNASNGTGTDESAKSAADASTTPDTRPSHETYIDENGQRRTRIYIYGKSQPPPAPPEEGSEDDNTGSGSGVASNWPDRPVSNLVDPLNPFNPMLQAAYDPQAQPPLATAPSDVPVPTPEPAKPLSTIQQITQVLKMLSPAAQAVDFAIDAYKDPQKKWQQVRDTGQGILGGVQQVPINLVGGIVSTGTALGGLLTGNEALKDYATDTAHTMDEWRKSSLARVGLDPDKLSPEAGAAEFLGQNISPGVVKTLIQLGIAKGVEFFAPQLKTAGEDYPIPNMLTPGSAEAATDLGMPPKKFMTPGGIVRMNDAQLSSMVYGTVLGLGFGMSVSHTKTAVRAAKEPAMRLFGMEGVFDPRRDVPGSPGTVAASIPSDILKGGVVDKWQAMNDVADRQARYEKGVWVGIDPVAADAVYQKSRIQTGAGAQNHVANAIHEGNMFADGWTFHVPTSFARIHEYNAQNPEFSAYLKARAYTDYLTQNRVANALPNRRQNPLPTQVEDRVRIWDEAGARAEVRAIEQAHPQVRGVYHALQENYAETRRFVSDNPQSRLENPNRLGAHAAQHPALPIFSEDSHPTAFIDRLKAGEEPLHIVESTIKSKLLEQMNWDTEVTYMQMSHRNAFNPITQQGPFTQRSRNWVGQAAVARDEGAVLKRRYDGNTIYYTADPFIVSLMNSGNTPMGAWGRFGTKFKQGFQETTTGAFAPYFAFTGAPRAMEQGWTTAPLQAKTASGRTVLPAGPVSSLYGAAARLAPQIAEHWAIPTTRWFEDHFNQTAMGQSLNPGGRRLITDALERAYHDSHYKFLLDHGAFSPDPLNFATEIQRNISRAQSGNTNPVMAPILRLMNNSSMSWVKWAGSGIGYGATQLYKGVRETGAAMQEGPNFGWTYKLNLGATPADRPTIKGRPVTDAEIAARHRAYTGDPATRGYIWSEDFKGNPETLRFSGPGQRRAAAYKAAAELAHGARTVTPWAGVLLQSPANTIKAMRDNPVKASLAFTASHVMPEMVSYIWNTYHGQQYIDYQMDNVTPAEIYIAIPGQKPQDGIRIPWYQEGYLTKAMTRAVAHQYMGRSVNNMWEDTQKALGGFMGVAVIPPMPSWLSAMFGMQGMSSPEGWIGDTYKRKSNPYIVLGGKESATELTWRNFMPSIADMSIAAYQAGIAAPNWGDVPAAATKEVSRRMVARAPILRDVIGWKPPVAGSTELGREAYKKQHVIDNLVNRYRIWDKESDISPKPASKGGYANVEGVLPSPPPTNAEGLIPNVSADQPKVVNPLYKKFMTKMEETFVKDSPEKGGIGYKSMWKEYGKYTKLIDKMRTTNEGNPQVFVKKMKDQPDTQQWLRDNKVDPFDYRQVRDFYNARRNEVLKQILYTIKATEQKIDRIPSVRKLLGDEHFEIEMLDPNDPNPGKSLAERAKLKLMGKPAKTP